MQIGQHLPGARPLCHKPFSAPLGAGVGCWKQCGAGQAQGQCRHRWPCGRHRPPPAWVSSSVEWGPVAPPPRIVEMAVATAGPAAQGSCQRSVIFSFYSVLVLPQGQRGQ